MGGTGINRGSRWLSWARACRPTVDGVSQLSDTSNSPVVVTFGVGEAGWGTKAPDSEVEGEYGSDKLLTSRGAWGNEKKGEAEREGGRGEDALVKEKGVASFLDDWTMGVDVGNGVLVCRAAKDTNGRRGRAVLFRCRRRRKVGRAL